MGKPIRIDRDTFVHLLEKIKEKFAEKAHSHAADEVRFADGTTFQSKLDAGELKGPRGDTGATGSDGAQGPQGEPGIQGPTGATGAPGPAGQNGVTPHIDPSTGNWFIGTQDTNVHAQGPQGPTGPTGPAGPNSISAATATSGLNGLLKASGNKVVQAVAGTDYAMPDVYKSDAEVDTGKKWIDGKPIYRYVHTYQVAMPCNPWTTIATLPFTIETLISDETLIDESATRGSGGTNPVAYPDSASLNSAVQFWGNTIMSYFGTGWKSYPGRVMYIHVNIEYTKASASDPPIEGPSMAHLEAPPDKAIARTDYIAMMAGIEIPEDAETDVEADAQSDPNGTEGPGIDGEPAPSAHYDAVARYYKYDCWSAAMVRNAAGRWITEAEADEILDDEQTEGE